MCVCFSAKQELELELSERWIISTAIICTIGQYVRAVHLRHKLKSNILLENVTVRYEEVINILTAEH